MIRLILFLLLLAVPATAQQVDYYRLAIEDLACIQANLDAYRAMGDPVLLSTDNCPPKGETSLLSIFRNELPTPEFADPDQLDRFLALTADALDCLSETELPEDAVVVRFYPDDCRIEAE